MAEKSKKMMGLEGDIPDAHIIEEENERLRREYEKWGDRPSVYDQRIPPPGWRDGQKDGDEDDDGDGDGNRENVIDMI